jgi:hypothetical protein
MVAKGDVLKVYDETGNTLLGEVEVTAVEQINGHRERLTISVRDLRGLKTGNVYLLKTADGTELLGTLWAETVDIWGFDIA